MPNIPHHDMCLVITGNVTVRFVRISTVIALNEMDDAAILMDDHNVMMNMTDAS